MIINFSTHELDLLEKALDAYEKEAGSNAMFGGLIGVIFTPKEDRDSARAQMQADLKKSEEDTRQRRIQTTLLRAKIYAAAAHESEHDITVSTTT